MLYQITTIDQNVYTGVMFLKMVNVDHQMDTQAAQYLVYIVLNSGSVA